MSNKIRYIYKFVTTLRSWNTSDVGIYQILFMIYLLKKYFIDISMFEENESASCSDLYWYISKMESFNQQEKEILNDVSFVLETLSNINLEINKKDFYEFIKKVTIIDLQSFVATFPTFNKSSSEFSLPLELVELIKILLQIDSKDKFLLKTNNLSEIVNLITNDKNSTIISKNKNFYIINKIILLILNNYKTELFYGDLYLSDVVKNENKYDKIFDLYPLGIKLDRPLKERILNKSIFLKKVLEKPAISADWIFITNSLEKLSKNGKLIVLMPNGILNKIIDKEIRKEMICNGFIEKVISLPEGIIEGVSLQLNIVVFSFNNTSIEFIDASNEFVEEKYGNNVRKLNLNSLLEIIHTNNSQKLKVLSFKDFDNDYNLIVCNEKIIYKNSKKLSDFVSRIYRGYRNSLKNSYTNLGMYEILGVSEIENGMLARNLKRVDPGNVNVDRFLLKNKDILVASHGQQVKVAIVDDIGNRKILPSGNFLVIRLKEAMLNPYYLEMFLNSTNGKSALKQITTGVNIKIISKNRILSLDIPIINIVEQSRLATVYKKKRDDLLSHKETLRILQNEVDNFLDIFYGEELE